MRHFEALAQDTDTVRTHPCELNKKRRLGSEVDGTPDTSDQLQPAKRSRSHTDEFGTPSSSCVDKSSAAEEDQLAYLRVKSPKSRAPKARPDSEVIASGG